MQFDGFGVNISQRLAVHRSDAVRSEIEGSADRIKFLKRSKQAVRKRLQGLTGCLRDCMWLLANGIRDKLTIAHSGHTAQNNQLKNSPYHSMRESSSPANGLINLFETIQYTSSLSSPYHHCPTKYSTCLRICLLWSLMSFNLPKPS